MPLKGLETLRRKWQGEPRLVYKKIVFTEEGQQSTRLIPLFLKSKLRFVIIAHLRKNRLYKICSICYIPNKLHI